MATISSLTVDDVVAARRQLTEAQSLVRETLDRLRQSQEENEMITRRRDELEGRLSTLEAEYEELLGASKQPQTPSRVYPIIKQRKPFMMRRRVMLTLQIRWWISRYVYWIIRIVLIHAHDAIAQC